MSEYAVQIALNICDFDLPPEEITKQIGVIPEVARQKGDQLLKKGKFARRSTWILYSKAEEYYSDFSEHMEYFKNNLSNKVEVLMSLSKKYDVTITILVSYDDKYFPSIYIDSWFINFASDIGSSIDIDVSKV